MTNQEVIEFLQRKISKDPYSAEEYHTAIAALKKQVAERVKYIERCESGLSTGFCAKCQTALCSNGGRWCSVCGQRLDWSVENV